MNPTYATLTVFSAISERPGEPGWIVDGAMTEDDGHISFVMNDAIAEMVTKLFDTQTTVVLQLSLDRSTADFIVLDPVQGRADPVLADGQGRHFHFESRRPVDRAGDRISLGHAEHNARNFAAQRAAATRRALKRAA